MKVFAILNLVVAIALTLVLPLCILLWRQYTQDTPEYWHPRYFAESLSSPPAMSSKGWSVRVKGFFIQRYRWAVLAHRR